MVRELEIGFGRGRFLCARASAHPEIAFVAVDWGKKWRAEVAARVARLGLTNVELLTGHAQQVIEQFETAAFDRVHIHFPDPWWKRRHIRRRLLDRAFMPKLARITRAGGTVYVQTDVIDYARVVLFTVEGSGLFENAAGRLAFADWQGEIPERSLREERCLRDRTPFVQMKFVRNHTAWDQQVSRIAIGGTSR